MTELKQIIDKIGINQSDLAKIMGVSRVIVNKWVKGEKPVPKKRKEQISELINSGEVNDFINKKHGKFNIKDVIGKMSLKEHLKNVVKVENVDNLGLILFLENGNKISVVADNGGEIFYYLYNEDDKCLGMLF